MCQHKFIYCEECDVVKCKTCKKVWGKKEVVKEYINIYPYQTYPYQYPGIVCCETSNLNLKSYGTVSTLELE